MIHWIGQPEVKEVRLSEIPFESAVYAPETFPIRFLEGEAYPDLLTGLHALRYQANEKTFAKKLIGETDPKSSFLSVASLNQGDQIHLYEEPNGGWQFLLTMYVADQPINDQLQLIRINEYRDQLVAGACWFPLDGILRVGESFNYNLTPDGKNVHSFTRKIEMIVLKQYNPFVEGVMADLREAGITR